MPQNYRYLPKQGVQDARIRESAIIAAAIAGEDAANARLSPGAMAPPGMPQAPAGLAAPPNLLAAAPGGPSAASPPPGAQSPSPAPPDPLSALSGPAMGTPAPAPPAMPGSPALPQRAAGGPVPALPRPEVGTEGDDAALYADLLPTVMRDHDIVEMAVRAMRGEQVAHIQRRALGGATAASQTAQVSGIGGAMTPSASAGFYGASDIPDEEDEELPPAYQNAPRPPAGFIDALHAAKGPQGQPPKNPIVAALCEAYYNHPEAAGGLYKLAQDIAAQGQDMGNLARFFKKGGSHDD